MTRKPAGISSGVFGILPAGSETVIGTTTNAVSAAGTNRAAESTRQKPRTALVDVMTNHIQYRYIVTNRLGKLVARQYHLSVLT